MCAQVLAHAQTCLREQSVSMSAYSGSSSSVQQQLKLFCVMSVLMCITLETKLSSSKAANLTTYNIQNVAPQSQQLRQVLLYMRCQETISEQRQVKNRTKAREQKYTGKIFLAFLCVVHSAVSQCGLVSLETLQCECIIEFFFKIFYDRDRGISNTFTNSLQGSPFQKT